jgi:Predicted nucleic acid-binding protein, contains PIN domain
MIVVADTSPLNYFIQIGHDWLLRSLYRRVLIPNAVLAELNDAGAPVVVQRWIADIPDWIEVSVPGTCPLDRALGALDPGEREAILLAQERHADLLLIDERRGRAEAIRRGLATTGTIGVLLSAGERALINTEGVYQRLIDETNFRVTPELDRSFRQRFRQTR